MSINFISILKKYNHTNTKNLYYTKCLTKKSFIINNTYSNINNRRYFHDSPNIQSTTTTTTPTNSTIPQHHNHNHSDSSLIELNKSINESKSKLNKQSLKLKNSNSNTITNSSILSNSNEYLKVYDNKELLSFLMIGLCTINKFTLQLCIKLFPYIPMFLIKSLVYRIYCGGETVKEVSNTGSRLFKRGINNMMISLTIEACEGEKKVSIDPQFIIDETNKSINEILVPHTISMIENTKMNINDIPSGYVALKPTGFIKNSAHVLKNYKNGEEKSFEELVEKISKCVETVYNSNLKLSKKYPDRVAPFVVAVIDAEKYDLQPAVYELQRRLYQKFNKLNNPISVVGTLQMYLTDSSNLLEYEEKLATKNGYKLGLKLVRGAYLHSEKNRNTVIHKSKQDTDENYNKSITYCINQILNQPSKTSNIGHLVIASHNSDSLKLATNIIYNDQNQQNPNKNNIVLGQLLGMADSITYDLITKKNIKNVIKYVAWGPPLETKEYLLRRLEENGDAVKNDNGWPLVKASFMTLIGRILKTKA
ncbi:PUT1 [Candida pseudojiufengensis]|uniref:PUT1 n=1 Tax=Candida pseudojiufengensis TaxID=497109 RepID=UPI002225AA58|nr:PUT1 [Candida pseudojiufengensis]KAI5958750.1 PUT1 [Candida pseudojiufengensis]